MGRVSIVNDERLGLQHVEGVIKRVDPESGRLVLEEGGRELHLEAGPHTSVFVRGGVSNLQALEEGASVRASFAEDGTRKIVRWIEVPREEQLESPDSRDPIDAPAIPTVPPPPKRVLPPIESMDQDAVKTKDGEATED